ncbi:amylo-alpha-1,6-glucosidase [Haloimpatiens sp. FM7330]|uniref:amylo-alpha-1,6-glucosidase n=1 Tax=Haloimpatiens sp. FM7330 TaxID=3298610 RepID=UPI00362C8A7A
MLGVNNFKDFKTGIEKEYLLTNGLGGFTSSTIIGANIRKYHGILNIAINPPTERYLIVSKVDEVIEVGGKEYKLYSNQKVGGFDNGFKYQTNFKLNPLPNFSYRVDGVFIDKTISLEHNSNTAVVVYTIKTLNKNANLKLYPLLNNRDHHDNSLIKDLTFTSEYHEDIVNVNINKNINLNMYCTNGTFIQQESFYENMYYLDEEVRGLNPVDNHFIPGYFNVKIPKNSIIKIGLVFDAKIACDSTNLNNTKNIKAPFKIVEIEQNRLLQLMKNSSYQNQVLKNLCASCDAYIVNRNSTKSKTIIAGYPWFTDWGRDTMIAFTGLTLCTKRFEDAKDILITFSKYLNKGILPNMFPDSGVQPLYNTIDASLWYFYAVYKYYEYTQDKEFISKILHTLKDIIEYHIKGTINHIKMDSDYLITGGLEGTQLTWMDVKIGDYVPTPRHGKAVEINALWYNALMTFEYLYTQCANNPDKNVDIKSINYKAGTYKQLAQKAKQNFMKKFWYEEGKYLYDVIRDDKKDTKIRPNMIYAVSLPFTMLNSSKEKHIVDTIINHLVTPYGLRSLSQIDNEYNAIYKGDRYHRDAAYHQGTVWSHLMGHFITAFMKVYKDKDAAVNFINPLICHLNDISLNHVNEVFDGDFPHTPGGCFAQAWSTAELLRCLVEDIQIK